MKNKLNNKIQLRIYHKKCSMICISVLKFKWFIFKKVHNTTQQILIDFRYYLYQKISCKFVHWYDFHTSR